MVPPAVSSVVALLFALGSYGLGALVQPLVCAIPRGSARHAIRFCLGAGAWAYLLLLGSALQPVSAAWSWQFLAGGFATAAVQLPWRVSGMKRYVQRRMQMKLPSWVVWSAAPFALLWLLHGFMCFGPLSDVDSLRAHLAIPKYYLLTGSTSAAFDGYEQQPGLAWLLYAMVLGSGGETAALLSSLAWGLAIGLLVYALGSRLGGRRVGFMALAVFYGMHFATYKLHRTGTDLQVTAFVVGAFYLLLQWLEERDPRSLVGIGLLLGFGCATKHNALCALPIVGAIVAWGAFAARATQLRPARLWPVAAVAWLALAGVWYVKCWRATGAPLFPFATGSFKLKDPYNSMVAPPGEAAEGQDTAKSSASAKCSALLGHLTAAWRIVFFPVDITIGHIAGGGEWARGWHQSLTPAWLALAPCWLLAGRDARRALVVLGIGCAFVILCRVWGTFLVRYASPAFPLMSAATAWLLVWLRDHAPRTRFALGVVVGLPLAVNFGASAAEALSKAPVIFGKETREQFLEKRYPEAAAFAYLDAHRSQVSRVLYFGVRSYFCNFPYERAADLNLRLMPHICKRFDAPAKLAAYLRAEGISHVVTDEDLLACPADSAQQQLVGEVRSALDSLRRKGILFVPFTTAHCTVYEVVSAKLP